MRALILNGALQGYHELVQRLVNKTCDLIRTSLIEDPHAAFDAIHQMVEVHDLVDEARDASGQWDSLLSELFPRQGGRHKLVEAFGVAGDHAHDAGIRLGEKVVQELWPPRYKDDPKQMFHAPAEATRWWVEHRQLVWQLNRTKAHRVQMWKACVREVIEAAEQSVTSWRLMPNDRAMLWDAAGWRELPFPFPDELRNLILLEEDIGYSITFEQIKAMSKELRKQTIQTLRVSITQLRWVEENLPQVTDEPDTGAEAVGEDVPESVIQEVAEEMSEQAEYARSEVDRLLPTVFSWGFILSDRDPLFSREPFEPSWADLKLLESFEPPDKGVMAELAWHVAGYIASSEVILAMFEDTGPVAMHGKPIAEQAADCLKRLDRLEASRKDLDRAQSLHDASPRPFSMMLRGAWGFYQMVEAEASIAFLALDDAAGTSIAPILFRHTEDNDAYEFTGEISKARAALVKLHHDATGPARLEHLPVLSNKLNGKEPLGPNETVETLMKQNEREIAVGLSLAVQSLCQPDAEVPPAAAAPAERIIERIVEGPQGVLGSPENPILHVGVVSYVLDATNWKLASLMWDRATATFEEVNDAVYDGQFVQDGTIQTRVNRFNAEIKKKGIPLRWKLRTGKAQVIKVPEPSPPPPSASHTGKLPESGS